MSWEVVLHAVLDVLDPQAAAWVVCVYFVVTGAPELLRALAVFTDARTRRLLAKHLTLSELADKSPRAVEELVHGITPPPPWVTRTIDLTDGGTPVAAVVTGRSEELTGAGPTVAGPPPR